MLHRISGSSIGVKIPFVENHTSKYGVCWFSRNELKLYKESRPALSGHTHIAVVNLLEEDPTIDRQYAVYSQEAEELVNGPNELVVVECSKRSPRLLLGICKNIFSSQYFEGNVYEQVISVVDTRNYSQKKRREFALKELKRRYHTIIEELNNEISKLDSLQLYEAVANHFPENRGFLELTKELQDLASQIHLQEELICSQE